MELVKMFLDTFKRKEQPSEAEKLAATMRTFDLEREKVRANKKTLDDLITEVLLGMRQDKKGGKH